MSQHQFLTSIGDNRPLNKPEMIFPDPNVDSEKFQFGLEAEFILVQSSDFRPLWYKDLSFKKLNEVLEGIDLEGIEGDSSHLKVESPHKKRMPYIVEGYHIPDKNFNMIDIQPKGLEIRTPVCNSIASCLKTYKELYVRLQKALEPLDLKLASLSHHPIETQFQGPMNKRRYDFWQWAMSVMTTYGPDINVSVPSQLLRDFQLKDFEQKVNYYTPALAAMCAGSPFYNAKPWQTFNNKRGASYRTFKRSVVAPAIEYHPNEQNRFEFKAFEMSPYIIDFENYFKLFLTLLLSKNLSGRSSKEERVYLLGGAARNGLKSELIRDRLSELLHSASILEEYGFSQGSLEKVHQQMMHQKTLSDELYEIYDKENSIEKVLQYVSELK